MVFFLPFALPKKLGAATFSSKRSQTESLFERLLLEDFGQPLRAHLRHCQERARRRKADIAG
jgi:hypothetical protein